MWNTAARASAAGWRRLKRLSLTPLYSTHTAQRGISTLPLQVSIYGTSTIHAPGVTVRRKVVENPANGEGSEARAFSSSTTPLCNSSKEDNSER
jgi:hypothetical protein